MPHKEHPVFNRRIFWDVDYDKLNYDDSAPFIVRRVFERGDVPDIRNCRRYYGDEQIAKILTKARWLPKPVVYLASAIFGNDLTDYKCYITAQSDPTHWLY
jgi:hypothetical protein